MSDITPAARSASAESQRVHTDGIPDGERRNDLIDAHGRQCSGAPKHL
jgi:hypothetical protein